MTIDLQQVGLYLGYAFCVAIIGFVIWYDYIRERGRIVVTRKKHKKVKGLRIRR